MPKSGFTTYNLLISCPSDVVKYVNVIKECVESFNHTIGDLNKSIILPKHWSTDSYPQSGDYPQELLNKQFIRDCDAAVAIFWTKFGTATTKFSSGTEEEIEEMLSSGKQVFLYFVDETIDPSKIDVEQYQKVISFKEKYKDRGIYSIVRSEDELRKLFTNHITMYFLPQFIGEKNHTEIKKESILRIRSINDTENGHISLEKRNLSESVFLEEKEKRILEKIESLNERLCLPRMEKIDVIPIDSQLKTENIKKLIADNSFVSKATNVEFNGTLIDTITSFAEKHSVPLKDGFWNLGNLKKGINALSLTYGGRDYTLIGEEQDKKRYEAMIELYESIIEYNEYTTFFSVIDEQKFIALTLSNEGTTFDEDIDIKLYIPKGMSYKLNSIPVPGINIIDDLLEMEFYNFAYKIQGSDTITPFTGYPVSFTPQIPPLFHVSASEEYKQQKEKYQGEIERIFCYQYYENEEYDIIVFHINYIKHNTNMAFPSLLLFKENPGEIIYEVTSKYNPNIIKGELIVDSI